MAAEKEIGTIISRYLGPLLDAMKDRNAKNASQSAGRLTFWQDGMLAELEKIADGKHDAKTIASLKEKLEESENRVEDQLKRLGQLRDQLAPSSLANQIDAIMHNNNFGKGTIRESIQILLFDFEPGGNQEGTADYANKICRKIAILNGELQKLGRMVEERGKKSSM